MRILIEITAAFIVALFAFVMFSRFGFERVPLDWIYSINEYLGTFGQEATENALMMVSMALAVLPAGLVFWVALKVFRRL